MNQLQTRHFLQSNLWAKFQRSLGNAVFTDQGQGWQYMAILQRGQGSLGKFNTRLYTPYGPAYQTQQALQQAIASLKALAKQQKVDYIRIEPVQFGSFGESAALPDLSGFAKCSRDSQPAMTRIVNLAQTEDQILKDFSKTNQYIWRYIERDGLSFRLTEDPKNMDLFNQMMAQTAARTGATFYAQDYYSKVLQQFGPSKNAGIYYTYHNDTPVSSLMFIDDFEAKTRYYMYAWSFDEARKCNAAAAAIMHMIFEAKKAGLEHCDLFGVTPVGDTGPRAGFSKFKRSFGGQDFEFSGSYELPIHKLRYKALQVIKKLA